MQATFVRTRGQPDRVYVVRSDASEASWSFPTYGDELPHDLVHLVVESAFGLARGFWGRVDAGVDPARVNAHANRVGGREKYAAFGDDRREILIAEALAAVPWSDANLDDTARRARYDDACASMKITGAPALDPGRCARVRTVLDRLRAEWRSFEVKGAIRLEFDSQAPERSLDRISSK